ncbi:MAG: hypothetical protein AB1758_12675, partial [Candidatus Eremiobacterota bacterium]
MRALRRIQATALLLLTLLGLIGWSRVGAQPLSPEPTPTDAADQASTRLRVEGLGEFPPGVSNEQARQMAGTAALLSCYRQLTYRARAMSLPQGAESMDNLTITAQHGGIPWLAWALRAEPVAAVEEGRRLRVTVLSPPVGEIYSAFPFLIRTTTYDLDRDGLPETIGAGFDGRVYVLKQEGGGFKVLGSTPSYAEFESTARHRGGRLDWEHVLLARVDSFVSVESAGPNRARVVARLSRSEAVNAFLAGEATEQRELVVELNKNEPAPEVKIAEPVDFTAV